MSPLALAMLIIMLAVIMTTALLVIVVMRSARGAPPAPSAEVQQQQGEIARITDEMQASSDDIMREFEALRRGRLAAAGQSGRGGPPRGRERRS